MNKVLIVTTSIGSEAVFRRFFSTYGRCDTSGLDVRLLVIGDTNSPAIDFESLPEYELLMERNIQWTYLDTESQQPFMEEKPFMEKLIPWKCVQRRNLGYLIGYREGYDCIITVDDDNYPVDGQFIRRHVANLTRTGPCPIVVSDDESLHWFNPCAAFDPRIVHRGFPWRERYRRSAVRTVNGDLGTRSVVASAGFWIGDPDIDAVARVEGNPKHTNVESISVENFCLAPNVVAPFNSQNTAFRREVIPAVFLKANIGRYDDIWAAYVLRALLMVTGDLVMYGHPLVKQDRNNHDILKDLENELFGMRHTPAFTEELFSLARDRRSDLVGLSPLACTREIAGSLMETSKQFDWYYRDLLRWIELLEA